MNAMTMGFTHEPYLWMDPRSKFALFIAANVLFWGNANRWLELVLMVALLAILINGRLIKMALMNGAVYFLFLMLDIYVAPLLSGVFGLVFLTLVRVFRLYMPMILSAIYLIRTTTVSEFVSAFRKTGIPETIIIPFSVMFRFFPTIGEEWRNITNAMRFRGIQVSAGAMFRRPIQTMTYILVPLLMSSAKIAGDLTAASLSRGLGGDGPRTSLKQVRFGWLDYLVVVGAVVYCGLCVYVRWGGRG